MRTKTRLLLLTTIVSSWILTTALPASADSYDPYHLAVSLFNVVQPDSQEHNWTGFTIGNSQSTIGELNNLIRHDGPYVLRIQTVQAYISTSGHPPMNTDYARVNVGSCSKTGGFYSYGAGQLVVAGSDHSVVTYNPGLVASLIGKNFFCSQSVLQSSAPAVVQVHGYLEPKK